MSSDTIKVSIYDYSYVYIYIVDGVESHSPPTK